MCCQQSIGAEKSVEETCKVTTKWRIFKNRNLLQILELNIEYFSHVTMALFEREVSVWLTLRDEDAGAKLFDFRLQVPPHFYT